ncbi:MAG: butyrate kinase [Acidobacteriota bacterium]|nr:butyrate kinase [Blastocatellia bacterium]MDW8239623.1 butyrate kinase [Acidobacteriota bacterium]
MYRILVINPGATSTKVAVFEDERMIISESLAHEAAVLKQFPTVWDQFEFRRQAIRTALSRWGYTEADFDVVVARGGLLKPVPGGVYRITERMLEDARRGVQGQHVSNLGAALAADIGEPEQTARFVVDPVSVDEFEPLARYSGHPAIARRSLSHALNIHAVARRAAQLLGKSYEHSHWVVAHLGGGISVCPVRGGRIIDANDAASSGPFSPERTGGLPLQDFITLCFSGRYTESQVRRMVMGEGGLMAYLGTNDATEVEQRIAQGDRLAHEVYQAMAYQIAKEIGAMATVLAGRVDAIILTGGLAHSRMLTSWIIARVLFIAPVMVMPGEFEMEALALGALRVLRGEESAREYE